MAKMTTPVDVDKLEEQQENCKEAIGDFSLYKAILRGLPYRIEDEIRCLGHGWSKKRKVLGKILEYLDVLRQAEKAMPNIENELIAMSVGAGLLKTH